MKKFKLTLFSLLAFILGLFCLASCGERENSSAESKSYAGTYKFQALRMEVGGAGDGGEGRTKLRRNGSHRGIRDDRAQGGRRRHHKNGGRYGDGNLDGSGRGK